MGQRAARRPQVHERRLEQEVRHAGRVDVRVALDLARQMALVVVGDKKWQEWMVKIMDPFTRRTDERFFDLDRLEDAWQWIKEGD